MDICSDVEGSRENSLEPVSSCDEDNCTGDLTNTKPKSAESDLPNFQQRFVISPIQSPETTSPAPDEGPTVWTDEYFEEENKSEIKLETKVDIKAEMKHESMAISSDSEPEEILANNAISPRSASALGHIFTPQWLELFSQGWRLTDPMVGFKKVICPECLKPMSLQRNGSIVTHMKSHTENNSSNSPWSRLCQICEESGILNSNIAPEEVREHMVSVHQKMLNVHHNPPSSNTTNRPNFEEGLVEAQHSAIRPINSPPERCWRGWKLTKGSNGPIMLICPECLEPLSQSVNILKHMQDHLSHHPGVQPCSRPCKLCEADGFQGQVIAPSEVMHHMRVFHLNKFGASSKSKSKTKPNGEVNGNSCGDAKYWEIVRPSNGKESGLFIFCPKCSESGKETRTACGNLAKHLRKCHLKDYETLARKCRTCEVVVPAAELSLHLECAVKDTTTTQAQSSKADTAKERKQEADLPKEGDSQPQSNSNCKDNPVVDDAREKPDSALPLNWAPPEGFEGGYLWHGTSEWREFLYGLQGPPRGGFGPLRGRFGPPRGEFGLPRVGFGPPWRGFGPPRGGLGPWHPPPSWPRRPGWYPIPHWSFPVPTPTDSAIRQGWQNPNYTGSPFTSFFE